MQRSLQQIKYRKPSENTLLSWATRILTKLDLPSPAELLLEIHKEKYVAQNSEEFCIHQFEVQMRGGNERKINLSENTSISRTTQ